MLRKRFRRRFADWKETSRRRVARMGMMRRGA
jgi:hypothetical protein